LIIERSVTKSAMLTAIHSLPIFPHFVLLALLEDAFIDHFADRYHSFRAISDAITGFGCTVNWIGLPEPEIQAIWMSRFGQIQPPEKIEARADYDGFSDDREISRIGQDWHDIEEELFTSRSIVFHV
jgi:hypothetical protein